MMFMLVFWLQRDKVQRRQGFDQVSHAIALLRRTCAFTVKRMFAQIHPPHSMGALGQGSFSAVIRPPHPASLLPCFPQVVVDEEPPWTLPTSIFAPRQRENEARDFYDNERVGACLTTSLQLWLASIALHAFWPVPSHSM